MNTGEYYHIVATYSPTIVKIYVNGIEENNSTSLTSGVSFGSATRIGWGTINQGYFDGKIPLVRTYNRALTGAEVKQNFEAQKSKFGF